MINEKGSFLGKRHDKRQFEKPMGRKENNIKMDLKGKRCENVD
jgi:hypothetical protein